MSATSSAGGLEGVLARFGVREGFGMVFHPLVRPTRSYGMAFVRGLGEGSGEATIWRGAFSGALYNAGAGWTSCKIRQPWEHE
jgi:hypothetical protein